MGKNIVIRRSSIILAILMFVLGFVVSRLTIGEQELKTKTVIKYKKQPYSVHDTIVCPVPYAEYRDTGSIKYIFICN